MEFNADNLRRITSDAILRKQQQEEEKKRQEDEKKRLEELAERNRAQRIIDDGVKNALVKAQNGENKHMIMRLEKYGTTRDCNVLDSRQCLYADLSNCAKIVYSYFKETAKMNVEIVWDHDGVGVKDWFNMYISW